MKQNLTELTPSVSEFETLTLRLEPDQLSNFFPILQKGVMVPATVGCTLKSLLCDQFAIPADYVSDRITTIFIDNCPVDDLDRTVIQDGSRVTLSAAMPGLVGATMRRGGYYAALRQGISHVLDSGKATNEFGIVRLKLFNLLLVELGPLVLARGLLLESEELSALLQSLPDLSIRNQNGAGSRTLLSIIFRG